MYWYISFLRPPPVSVASTAEGVTITPQVANDLRTELRYEPTTIHYRWQRLGPLPLPASTAQELTLFQPPTSTYKPLTVSLPPNVQPGESWRLGLFCLNEDELGPRPPPEQGCSSLLSLCAEPFSGVLGVWSEGIRVTRPDPAASGVVKGVNGKQAAGKRDKGGEVKGKGKGKGKEKENDDGPKQGRITREFRLPSDENEDGGWLKIVEQTSFDLDKKIWDSGLALSAWLWRHLPLNQVDVGPTKGSKVVLDILQRDSDLRILEIGSGTGLVSIALALATRCHLPNVSRRITATDLGSAIPLMEENMALNGLASPTEHASGSGAAGNADASVAVTLDSQVLDWDEPVPSWVAEEWPEIIIAADVTYNTSAFPSLIATLDFLLNPPETVRKMKEGIRPLLLLAYKQRDPAERGLWDLLDKKGVEMVHVDTVRGAGEEGATEIWLGSSI